jgi:hypothetical protein
VLGGLGVVYSALLTAAFRGSLGGLPVAIGRLAGLTLLMMGIMELLLVDDAKRLLGGVTRRCLSGIPFYIWPLLMLFAYMAAGGIAEGHVASLILYAAAIAYAAASRPPEGASARCTAAAALVLAAGLWAAVAPGSATGAVGAVMAAAIAVAPFAPLPLSLRERLPL